MPKENALAIMLKAPRPGTVKTRLVPPLTHLEACELYECFIRDTFRTSSNIDAALYAFYTPKDAFREIERLFPGGITAIAQEDGGLGERIFGCFKELFGMGYKKIVVIGSDSPDIPGEHIEDAFRQLSHSELVLGPAKDGGYYLVAMSRLTEEPFLEIPWSTDKVLEATLDRASRAQIPFRLIAPWHDMDTVGDLRALKDSKSAVESANYLSSRPHLIA